jgi:hypothetical protein
MTAGGQGKLSVVCRRRVVVFQLLVMPVPRQDSRQLQVRDSVGISKISETRRLLAILTVAGFPKQP